MKTAGVALHTGLALAVLLAAPPVHAEDETRVKVGQRVRVTAGIPGRFTGTTLGNVVSVTPDSLTLVDRERGSVLELPLSSLHRLEVSQGRRRRTGKGFLIGAGIGVALGAMSYAGAGEGQACGGRGEPSRECTTGEKLGFAAAATAGGALSGAFIGSMRNAEIWADTPVDRLKVTLRPGRGGVRASLALSF